MTATLRTFATLALAAALSLPWAAPAAACAVCYGDADSAMTQGLQASVLFMVGVTYFVILGGVATFLVLRHRARARSLGAANDCQQQQGA